MSQIVEQEAQRFTKEWARRRNGPVIEQLTRWCETRRQDAVQHLLSRLRGKLSDADCAATEKAFSLFQNQFLHGPIRALTEETHAGGASGYTLAEALLKLFRLPGAKKGTGPLGQGSHQSTGPIRPGPPHPPAGRTLLTTGGRVEAYLADAENQSGSERR
jgi:hypothetical protein